MEEKNTNYKFLFDDKELEDEEYIAEEDFKPIVSKVEKEKIEEEINEIIKSMKMEYE